MGTYKHYVNPKEPGLTCFVTATCLDFAHLFKREEMRTRMALSLLRDCIRFSASLRGFVVMTHHIHLVVRPAESQTISDLMRSVKSNSKDRLIPLLSPSERSQLSMQSGLNKHEFWMRSFRANPIYSEDVLVQKLNYLHLNPVRSALVEASDDYIWSSAHMYSRDFGNSDYGLDLKNCVKFYEELIGY